MSLADITLVSVDFETNSSIGETLRFLNWRGWDCQNLATFRQSPRLDVLTARSASLHGGQILAAAAITHITAPASDRVAIVFLARAPGRMDIASRVIQALLSSAAFSLLLTDETPMYLLCETPSDDPAFPRAMSFLGGESCPELVAWARNAGGKHLMPTHSRGTTGWALQPTSAEKIAATLSSQSLLCRSRVSQALGTRYEQRLQVQNPGCFGKHHMLIDDMLNGKENSSIISFVLAQNAAVNECD